MSLTRSVMYLGNKAMKFDNVNGVPERKWHGPGTIVSAITPVQADKLCSFKEEFLDVTGMTEKEVLARGAKARADSEERKRASRRGTGKPSEVTLRYASEEELEAELRKRRAARAAQSGPAETKPAAASKPAPSKPAGKNTGKKPAAEKSKSQQDITEAVESTIGKLLEKNDADDFKDGIPTKTAVERELGFPLTDDEYTIALGGKAPAEIPDKTEFDAPRQ